ncbi:MAG: class I SAM-dependent methyltransferase [bacterium]|nr:class I SAM-dependent methyltransferase [bacterium]
MTTGARDEKLDAGQPLHRVANCWNRIAAARRETSLHGWLDCYQIAAKRLNARVAGSPDVNWLNGLVKRLRIEPDSRWLSIGCGAADQEILAAREGLFASMDAIDISRTSLEAGRGAAAAAGVANISFLERDLYDLEPGPDTYDVVFMNMSLHHVKDLDGVLSRIARCLRPEGFLLLNEYIGPRQFQFTDVQLAIVEDLLTTLPEYLRKDLATGEIKTRYEKKPIEFWNIADPSEAIRSDLIVAAVDDRFEVVERIDYGGSILHLLLEHIIHNFDPGSEFHITLLSLLSKVEDVLIDCEVLGSDFAVLAARRKDAPPFEVEPARPRPATVAASADPEIEYLRGELAKANSYIEEIEASRGWRVLQRARRLLGRRW